MNPPMPVSRLRRHARLNAALDLALKGAAHATPPVPADAAPGSSDGPEGDARSAPARPLAAPA